MNMEAIWTLGINIEVHVLNIGWSLGMNIEATTVTLNCWTLGMNIEASTTPTGLH